MQADTTQYAAMADAFSLSAPLYDAEHAANVLARWTRRRSLDALYAAFAPGDRVVELGCGTGMEAVSLARRGVHILATDVAPQMIAALESKLRPAGPAADLRELIQTRVLPAGQADELVDSFGAASFDGAYSSFGALNCEPSLAPVVAALAELVRPGGRVILSLINRYCLWETAWYLRARQPANAFRRWRGQAQATVRGEWQDTRVPVYYWTPGQMERAFAPTFRTQQRMALTWLLPPQYLDGLVHRAPRLFRRLARLERRSANLWPFYTLGDHFLIVLERATSYEPRATSNSSQPVARSS